MLFGRLSTLRGIMDLLLRTLVGFLIWNWWDWGSGGMSFLLCGSYGAGMLVCIAG